MKRKRFIKFSGIFIDRHNNKTIKFNERILINNDKDEIKQIKKHLDMLFKVNIHIEQLPNGQYKLKDVI